MKTPFTLGPADHGRPLTLDEFLQSDYQEGYQYELIDARLYVVPMAEAPEAVNEWCVFRRLFHYADAQPEVINFVYNKTRVFVPGHTEPTVVGPDIAAYHGFPLRGDRKALRWQDHNPILVVEVVSESDPDKDLVRNVDLYLEVPSIREYWILDPRSEILGLQLLIYRRRGQRWQKPIVINEGETYAPRILPGFSLLLDPQRS